MADKTADDYADEIAYLEGVVNSGVTQERVGTEGVTYDLAAARRRLAYLKGLTKTSRPRRRMYRVDLSGANE